MRVAAVFVLIVFSIIALCGAEDSPDTSISLLEREAREAASPVRQNKSKNSRKIKKKKKNKKSGKIKKKENRKAKKKNNNKGKDLRKNKLGKNKKRKKRKNEKKRRMKKGSNKRKSKAKNKNRKQKKVKKVIKHVQSERSSKDTCTDKQAKAARTIMKQAKQIDKWYSLLTTKAQKDGVFANYSRTLGEMSGNGTICGAARNASEFLADCSSTAKSACDTSNFTENVTIISDNNCKNISCSNIPLECKEKVDPTFNGLKELKLKKCQNPTYPGSFSNCMKFVKELGTNIISDCVAEIKDSCDGTCEIVEEAGSIIIELTDTVPPITTRPTSGRSRKRFY